MRVIVGSPGGKYRVAKKIIKLFPEHKTYVEAFLGSGAVLLAKKPSEKEVGNDISEYGFAYKFLKHASDEVIKRLAKLNWKPSEALWNRLKKSNPKSPLERFRKFVYVTRYSYGRLSDGVYSPSVADSDVDIKKFARIRERIKNVEFYQQDYKEIIKRFDSPDTFFFFDPPYSDCWNNAFGKFTFDEKEFVGLLKKIKGKFLVTYSYEPEFLKLFDGFHLSKMLFKRTLANNDSNKSGRLEYELIVTNYNPKKNTTYLSEGEELVDIFDSDPLYGMNEDKVFVLIYHSAKPGEVEKSDNSCVEILKEKHRTGLIALNAVEIWNGATNKIECREGKLPKSKEVWITDGRKSYGLYEVNSKFEVSPLVVLQEPVPIKTKLGQFFVIKDMEFTEVDEYTRIPDENKMWNYGLKIHFRGKSLHGDLMFERENDSIGWTLLIQQPDVLSKQLTSVKDAKEWLRDNKSKALKINLDTGEIPEANSIRVVKKQPEPKNMLFEEGLHNKSHIEMFVEDIIKNREVGLHNEISIIYNLMEGIIMPGEIGALKDSPGVYILVDKGQVEYLYQSAKYHEYWISGGKLKEGRWIFQALEQKQYQEYLDVGSYHKEKIEKNAASKYFWIFSYAKNRTPYVLNPESITKRVVTPYGYSMVPKYIREQIPQDMRYWEVSKPSEALAMRAKLIESKVVNF